MKLRIVEPFSILAVIWILSLILNAQSKPTPQPCTEVKTIQHDDYDVGASTGPYRQLKNPDIW